MVDSTPRPDIIPKPEEHKTFDNIITTLRTSYPRDKMSEISTSFCFICLLHLANEEGLKLESARFDGLEGEDVGCQGVWEMDLPSTDQSEVQGKGKGRGRAEKVGRMGEGESEDRVVGELQALRVYKVSPFFSVSYFCLGFQILVMAVEGAGTSRVDIRRIDLGGG